jgi:hypothetical protein
MQMIRKQAEQLNHRIAHLVKKALTDSPQQAKAVFAALGYEKVVSTPKYRRKGYAEGEH